MTSTGVRIGVLATITLPLPGGILSDHFGVAIPRLMTWTKVKVGAICGVITYHLSPQINVPEVLHKKTTALHQKAVAVSGIEG